jgi:DNA invertase Pin-like site-specific DNA recombinase
MRSTGPRRPVYGLRRVSSSTSATPVPKPAARHWTASRRLPGLARSARSWCSGVMVFGLDRLGRSLRDLLLLLDELAAAGCAVISLRESIDLTPTGRLLVHLIAALAEFERELIRERVRSGIARVKATGRTRSGKTVGRPRRSVDVHAALARRAQGRSWREIAQALKVPGQTLRRACGAAGA